MQWKLCVVKNVRTLSLMIAPLTELPIAFMNVRKTKRLLGTTKLLQKTISVRAEKERTVIGMAEYIEREALRNALYDADAITMNGVKILNQFPAADVAPIRHGRWIGIPLCGSDDCECSECGNWCNIHVNLCGEAIQKYCPYCGAKMDGGASNAVS